MNTEILSLPEHFLIDFEFQNNIGDMLIASSLVVLALAEVAINNDELDYWNIDERLNKHRTVRDFDTHVQKMMYALKEIGKLKASVVKSSSNNYHYVEYNDFESSACLRVLHTFDPGAKYMKKYLKMNEDTTNPKFAYIQYTLDATKTKVRKVKAVIPYTEGKSYISCNLLQQFMYIKQSLGQLHREDVNGTMKVLKTEIAGTIPAGRKIAIEKGVENNG